MKKTVTFVTVFFRLNPPYRAGEILFCNVKFSLRSGEIAAALGRLHFICEADFLTNIGQLCYNLIEVKCLDIMNADDSAIRSITDSTIDANQMLFIETSLKEYQEIRTELREVIARQNTVLFSTIAQFATLIGLGLTVLPTGILWDTQLWSSCIFGVLIPCITILLGVIWIDLAYRQVMMASYVYLIETQVSQLLHMGEEETQTRKVMFWEHYNHKRKKVDILSYLCSMIVYLVAPALCYFVFLYCSDWKWLDMYYITAIFFGICLLFILAYCVSIWKIYKSR